MKLLPLAILCSSMLTFAVGATEYEIKLESNGEAIATIQLSITSDTAVAQVGNVTEQFDLKNQRWQHDESKQWVTLSQCESWAKESKEKTSTVTSTCVPVTAVQKAIWREGEIVINVRDCNELFISPGPGLGLSPARFVPSPEWLRARGMAVAKRTTPRRKRRQAGASQN